MVVSVITEDEKQAKERSQSLKADRRLAEGKKLDRHADNNLVDLCKSAAQLFLLKKKKHASTGTLIFKVEFCCLKDKTNIEQC